MSNRDNFWFGTVERPRWIRTPNTGADMSPSDWNTSGEYLSGGAFAFHSWGSHKRYVFEWPASSSREMASLMKAYRDGAYGRGLIYFVDPLIYDQNVLPSQWAYPGVALDEEWSHVGGIYPEYVSTPTGDTNTLPISSVGYDLTSVTAGFRGAYDAVFIPQPEGYVLDLGAFYSATLTGGVYYSPVLSSGSIGAAVQLTALGGTAGNITPDTTASGLKGVYLWVGKTASDSSSVTITAMIARLRKSSATPKTSGPWVQGMGHSGCRFAGPPTYVANTGVEGGRIGFAATFVEVGDWQ